MYNYIQVHDRLEESNYLYPSGTCTLPEIIDDNPNLILVNELIDISNHRYNIEKKEWEEYNTPPTPEPEEPKITIDNDIAIMKGIADIYSKLNKIENELNEIKTNEG